MSRLRVFWLLFLRYANAIDLHAAQRSDNLSEIAWCRIRIAELDRQIEIERMNRCFR